MKDVVSAVFDFLKEQDDLRLVSDDFVYEVYPDRGFELTEQEITNIVDRSDPKLALWDIIEDKYCDILWNIKTDLQDAFVNKYAAMISSDEEVLAKNTIDEMVFLDTTHVVDAAENQRVQVDIILDTGDANYDFVCNSFQCEPHNKASLLWLIRQQGCEDNFLDALDSGDEDSGFLRSCIEEVNNCCSDIAALTFLVDMTLGDMLDLNENMEEGKGSIVLNKRTTCGLCDFWNGAGSVFGIDLQDDVKIPISLIFSAMPDGYYGRSVDEIYGMCGSAWKDTFELQY